MARFGALQIGVIALYGEYASRSNPAFSNCRPRLLVITNHSFRSTAATTDDTTPCLLHRIGSAGYGVPNMPIAPLPS